MADSDGGKKTLQKTWCKILVAKSDLVLIRCIPLPDNPETFKHMKQLHPFPSLLISIFHFSKTTSTSLL